MKATITLATILLAGCASTIQHDPVPLATPYVHPTVEWVYNPHRPSCVSSMPSGCWQRVYQ